MLHGWGSGYDVHLRTDSYLHILYCNMLHEKRTVPMIIVGVEMYTDKLKYKEKIEEKDETLLAAYNKVVKDIPHDLMPFIEKHYPVRTDREGTAIMGVSQGGTKALATGFENLERFGYIASFAPDPGSVPTNFLKDTIWNAPLLKDSFPPYHESLEPYYLYLAVGSEDPENVEVTKHYGELLARMGYRNRTDVAKGYEHDYIFWRVGFYNFMNKIFRP
jgi:enterochelin esterase-like enzyme